MASLSVDQIKERIERPLRRNEIEKAVRHEERIKLHAKTVIEEGELGEGFRLWCEWVQGFLPPDVYAKFIKLARTPFPTVEVVETIFDECSRIFEGKNKFYKTEFKSAEYETDANTYLDRIKFNQFWRQDGFEASRDSFNSYIVVDLPAEQNTLFPEPYFYLLDAINLWDVGYDIYDNIEWVLIKEAQDRLLYIDDKVYQRFIIDNQIQALEPVFHIQKRCPVRNFSKFKRTRKNPIDRKSILTSSVGELDWLLFFETSKKYLDLYGPFPIYSGYEQRCSYSENGSRCDNGLLHYSSEQGSHSITCPSCKGKSKLKIGVGSYIEIPAPSTSQEPDMRNPVQVLPAEINSLEYCRSEVERLEQEIIKKCIGQGGEPNTDQAQNEKQVRSAYESKVNILNQFKENFEEAEKWTKETILRFRYGDSFVNSTVSYGDDFYLTSVKDLSEDYKMYKDTGRPEFELIAKREQIYSTENKNNPDRLTRYKILEDLLPFPDLKLSEVKALGFDELYPLEFILKADFNSFIRRFEREQAPLEIFGSLLNYDSRINLIKSKLEEYGNERINAARRSEPKVEGSSVRPTVG